MMTKENPLQIVDVSEVNDKVANELLDAATSQGFLMVEGHGFSKQEIADLFQTSSEFFAQEQALKDQVPYNPATNHGYSWEENLDPSRGKKADPKEALNFANLNCDKGTSTEALPPFFIANPERRELVENTIAKLYQLSIKLLKLLAIGLEIEDTNECKGEDWFVSRYDAEKSLGTTFRFLHYPSQGLLDPDELIRAGAHTDYGSMTLLFQKANEEGLEILSPVLKKWEPVPYVESRSKNNEEAPPIIVNIADQLSYWSGGLLKSTVHRVKFPLQSQANNQDRYSIVFFSHPNHDALLEPVPSAKIRSIEGRGPQSNAGKVLTAKEHLDKRLAATYKY